MRKILAARDVTCPVCNAAPGELCTFVKHPDPAYRGTPMTRSTHSERAWAAQDAQRTMEVLLGD